MPGPGMMHVGQRGEPRPAAPVFTYERRATSDYCVACGTLLRLGSFHFESGLAEWCFDELLDWQLLPVEDDAVVDLSEDRPDRLGLGT